MQARQVQHIYKSHFHHVQNVQSELHWLGFKIIVASKDLRVFNYIPRSLEATKSHRSFQHICDRMLKEWPPQETSRYSHSEHVIGQLGFLLSQKRVPEAQCLLETLHKLDGDFSRYAQVFMKCLLYHGIRVFVSDEQWEDLGKGELSDSILKWARVIFHPESESRKEDYLQCCQELIKYERCDYISQSLLPALLKYWAVQGESVERLMEFLIKSVQWIYLNSPWETFFSTFDDAGSFWQVWRDAHPGHFDDFNSVMTKPLPDGRTFFLALWKAFQGKCEYGVNHHGLLAHLTGQGVDLRTEVSPGRDHLDELAGQGAIDSKNPEMPHDDSLSLFYRLTLEEHAYDLVPLIFARLTKSMQSRQRLNLLFNLLKSPVAGLRWRNLYDSSGRLNPLWHQVLPDEMKAMSDLLFFRQQDGVPCFVAFWKQDHAEALRWLFEKSGSLVGADFNYDLLGQLVKQLLDEGDSSGLHKVIWFLEPNRADEVSLLPDACRRHLFRSVLTTVQSQPGREHTFGGAMRLLRVLAEGHKLYLKELDELSKAAWHNIFDGNTPLPDHIAAIALQDDTLFLEFLKDLRNYFPDKVSLFSLRNNMAPCRLEHVGGSSTIPPNSVLFLDGHGGVGRVAGYPAEELAEQLYKLMSPLCQTLPDRILLETCYGSKKGGTGSLSSVEMFALRWCQKTRKPVSVLGYEGLVHSGGLLHPRRKVFRKSVGKHDLRLRHSRELLVTASGGGRMKRDWRSPHTRHYRQRHRARYFPWGLNFSRSNA